jgi:ubiquinone/menaquinone biosynthesis C-methylase UbiE
LLSDVYHELDDPAAMLDHLERALRPRGVIALLEFRAEDPKVPIKPEHKMSRKQILLELGANGFELVRSFDELPWQHLMFFAPKRR